MQLRIISRDGMNQISFWSATDTVAPYSFGIWTCASGCGAVREAGGLMVSALVPTASGPGSSPAACFSKAPETFRARKAIFCSTVFKNREVYKPETSCMKGTSVHIKNT